MATVGTTSSTSADPVAAVADIAAREGLWLHVDAAYAGVVALLPDRRAPFAGWERADSIVINPHKWLFTPLDASLLLSRRMDQLRAAFSLVPEYLRTLDRVNPVLDYNEYQPQLGRRMRALKLWMQLRWFGLEGLRRRIAYHLEQAERVAAWIDADPDWERLAPAPFSTVCFRYRPARLAGREDEPEVTGRPGRAQHPPDGRRQPDGRGLPQPHPPARPLHHPDRHRQPAHGAAPRRTGVGAAATGGRPTRHPGDDPMTEPIEVQYFYRTRWGCHDEFVELFRKNHWPILREQWAAGRYVNVELFTPRFHGGGGADWDVMVSITYRDWAAIQEHSDGEIVLRLYPEPSRPRSGTASSCSRRTGTSSWRRAAGARVAGEAPPWVDRASLEAATPASGRDPQAACQHHGSGMAGAIGHVAQTPRVPVSAARSGTWRGAASPAAPTGRARRPGPAIMAPTSARPIPEADAPVPPITELTRIEPVHLARLEKQGIFTTGILLEVSETATRRQSLADHVKATTNDVSTWRDEALMLNLAGFGPAEHQLFIQAGIEGLRDLLAVDLDAFRARARQGRRGARHRAAARPDDRDVVGAGADARGGVAPPPPAPRDGPRTRTPATIGA